MKTDPSPCSEPTKDAWEFEDVLPASRGQGSAFFGRGTGILVYCSPAWLYMSFQLWHIRRTGRYQKSILIKNSITLIWRLEQEGLQHKSISFPLVRGSPGPRLWSRVLFVATMDKLFSGFMLRFLTNSCCSWQKRINKQTNSPRKGGKHRKGDEAFLKI